MTRKRLALVPRSGHSVRSCALILSAALCILGSSLPANAKDQFLAFDPEDSVATVPTGINTEGAIVGLYSDKDAVIHGFVRSVAGLITAIDIPGATDTSANGVNANGVIVGTFQTGGVPGRGIVRTRGGAIIGPNPPGIAATGHGFVRAPDGTFTTFDVPGAMSTDALGINKKGEIAGNFVDTTKRTHGFFRTAKGKIRTFVVAGGTKGTFVTGINDQGAITGFFTDNFGIETPYVRAPDGTKTIFDPDGANSARAVGINASGAVAGEYDDFSTHHCFVRAPDGTITSFNPFGSTDIVCSGIDNDSAVYGGYFDDRDTKNGFVRVADGREKSLAFPGAISTGALGSNTHVTFGLFEGNDGHEHGFIRFK